MATSLTWAFFEDMAFSAAPVPRPPPPRPPQPTSATRMVLSPAAWTAGRATPASAVAAAVLMTVRRDRPLSVGMLTGRMPPSGKVTGKRDSVNVAAGGRDVNGNATAVFAPWRICARLLHAVNK